MVRFNVWRCLCEIVVFSKLWCSFCMCHYAGTEQALPPVLPGVGGRSRATMGKSSNSNCFDKA
jgi:hypothetical protein